MLSVANRPSTLPPKLGAPKSKPVLQRKRIARKNQEKLPSVDEKDEKLEILKALLRSRKATEDAVNASCDRLVKTLSVAVNKSGKAPNEVTEESFKALMKKVSLSAQFRTCVQQIAESLQQREIEIHQIQDLLLSKKEQFALQAGPCASFRKLSEEAQIQAVLAAEIVRKDHVVRNVKDKLRFLNREADAQQKELERHLSLFNGTSFLLDTDLSSICPPEVSEAVEAIKSLESEESRKFLLNRTSRIAFLTSLPNSERFIRDLTEEKDVIYIKDLMDGTLTNQQAGQKILSGKDGFSPETVQQFLDIAADWLTESQNDISLFHVDGCKFSVSSWESLLSAFCSLRNKIFGFAVTGQTFDTEAELITIFRGAAVFSSSSLKLEGSPISPGLMWALRQSLKGSGDCEPFERIPSVEDEMATYIKLKTFDDAMQSENSRNSFALSRIRSSSMYQKHRIEETFEHLTSLDLSRCKINDSAVGSLISIIDSGAFPSLQHLDLKNNEIGVTGIAAIAIAAQKAQSRGNFFLHSLSLSANRLTDEAVVPLLILQSSNSRPVIFHLDLSCNQLGNSTLAALIPWAHRIPSTSIFDYHINLEWNEISDERTFNELILYVARSVSISKPREHSLYLGGTHNNIALTNTPSETTFRTPSGYRDIDYLGFDENSYRLQNVEEENDVSWMADDSTRQDFQQEVSSRGVSESFSGEEDDENLSATCEVPCVINIRNNSLLGVDSSWVSRICKGSVLV